MKPYGIHWFRRDLRVAGNPALQLNWKRQDGRVVGLFSFDKGFLARPDFSVNRFQLFLETLVALKDELRRIGSDLLLLDTGPMEAFPKLFSLLKARELHLPQLFSWNRDYEPFSVDRDHQVAHWLREHGVPTATEHDHILIEPGEIRKPDHSNSAYQIYTPYSRRWLEEFQSDVVRERIHHQKMGLNYLSQLQIGKVENLFSLKWNDLLGTETEKLDVLEEYRLANRKKVTVQVPKAGSLAALGVLKDFKKRLSDYAEARDIPAVDGTSHFSLYFKNGSLTSAQVIAELGLEPYTKGEKTNRAKFFSELIWREFYYYVLAKFPYVETSAFQTRYEKLSWQNNESHFEAWKNGLTGYPIVDAGMRQLKQTGWMHNRVRMIVASFLTKDLLIDWRWGERYFMENLLDGDLAPNNGGWQWAASTGCDAQPYFRIFNPELQSERYDPHGLYIKHYVPELAHFSAKEIHNPPYHSRGNYPQPIVDHSEQISKALRLFQMK